MQRIYLASPFFSAEQIARVEQVSQALAKNDSVGYIYEPMKHQNSDIIARYGNLENAMKSREWQDATYDSDIQAIRQSDAVVAILDYQFEDRNILPDPGTVYEIGFAQAIGKPIILIQLTDIQDDPMNLMLSKYTAYFDQNNFKDLVNYDFQSLPQLNTYDRQVF